MASKPLADNSFQALNIPAVSLASSDRSMPTISLAPTVIPLRTSLLG